ncbi:MAG: hypothetical protein ABUS79_05735 [Pseudomonadota bacterium]
MMPPATDAALFARRLLPAARAAFQMVPPTAIRPLHAAVDAFVEAPAPSSFLAAFRLLDQARRRAMVEQAGGGVLRRAFQDGVAALRRISALPTPAVDALAAHAEVDARAGERLHALAALTGAYQELSARVAADGDRRRQLWKTFPRPRPRRRPRR